MHEHHVFEMLAALWAIAAIGARHYSKSLSITFALLAGTNFGCYVLSFASHCIGH